MMFDVAVIGGGVSGLAMAYELMQRGHRVVVVERQVRAGGNAVSERVGGFLIEHGPSSVNAASPAAALLSQSLGLDPLRCALGPGVRHRYLVGKDGLHRISTRPFGFLTSDYLSLRGRLRMLAEVVAPGKVGDEEETVAQFWCRRFGPEFVDRVIDPLVGGLYAATADELSMTAVFPVLLEMEREYGSITCGMLRRRFAGGTMPGRQLYSWREGVSTLPRSLAEKLGSAVKTGITVRRIKPLCGGYQVEVGTAGALKARAVVVATQPHVAAALLEEVDLAGAEAAAAIDAPPLSVVFLGYRRQQVGHPLDGMGYLTPASEKRALTGALFCSTMFSGRAPEGHVALAGYIGGSRAPDLALLTAPDLVALARAEFHDLVGARGEPVIARVRQWLRGLPQYRLGHGRRIATLLGIEERRPGLFVTGNYFSGPSVATCLTQARETSLRVRRFLAARAGETALLERSLSGRAS